MAISLIDIVHFVERYSEMTPQEKEKQETMVKAIKAAIEGQLPQGAIPYLAHGINLGKEIGDGEWIKKIVQVVRSNEGEFNGEDYADFQTIFDEYL
jgi:hypothetical protein